MYHCDITWNIPDPSEDQQHKPEQGPQYQEREHQRQQSREQVAVPTEHSHHTPHQHQQQQQQQQRQHYDLSGFVNLLAPNARGPVLR
ncbi:hypothetical protein LZ31DRAFT_275616 [Colletotrichum somersetense]|nr:hypothetical protein LZ31DRAFT_275616 [Colletotrichum somersetense]